MPDDKPCVTMVLPHREVFGPVGAGAVAMVVRRFAADRSRYVARVVGPPFAGAAFPAIDFVPVRAARLLPLSTTQLYTLGVARYLRRQPPGLIEVFNKPDVALLLARLFPGRPVTLFLQNDPRAMRGARTPAARKRLLRRLARVVTASDFLRRCLLDGIDAPARPPAVIFNTLDPSELPQPLPPGARDRVIVFAGRVVPDKAPDAFVAACAHALPQLPAWRAEIIGADGFSADAPDSSFVRGLRPAAAAADVVLRGYMPHADVLRAMARAAIVVVPSRWEEPFGLAALEALACGAALACSGRGGLSEVMGDAAVRIDPDDTAAMGEAFVRLARDDGLRAALSARGQARVRDHFSAAGAIAALNDIRDGARGSH